MPPRVTEKVRITMSKDKGKTEEHVKKAENTLDQINQRKADLLRQLQEIEASEKLALDKAEKALAEKMGNIREILGQCGITGTVQIDVASGTWARVTPRKAKTAKVAKASTKVDYKALSQALKTHRPVLNNGDGNFKVGDLVVRGTDIAFCAMAQGAKGSADILKMYPELSVKSGCARGADTRWSEKKDAILAEING